MKVNGKYYLLITHIPFINWLIKHPDIAPDSFYGYMLRRVATNNTYSNCDRFDLNNLYYSYIEEYKQRKK